MPTDTKRQTAPTFNYDPESTKMSLEESSIASATTELLEGRLQRLEYLLTGDSQWTGQPSAPPKPESLDDTVARRLSRLETALSSLSKSNPAVHDLLQLCMSLLFHL